MKIQDLIKNADAEALRIILTGIINEFPLIRYQIKQAIKDFEREKRLNNAK